MNRFLSILLVGSFMVGCHTKRQADMLVVNGEIYTVDSNFSVVEALAIKDGKILATGDKKYITENFEAPEVIDAQGKFVYPGFIDAHCHFMAYGKGLNECNLVGTKSWIEVLDRLKAFAGNHPEGWIIGRGWDQNDWEDTKFPNNDSLNNLFPDRPVYLSRIDGHAAIANQNALDQSGISPNQKISGGEIITLNGRLTGLLIDNAEELVQKHFPTATNIEKTRWLQDAERNCFEAGLTSVHDCGLDAGDVLLIQKMYDSNLLRMHMYVMLSDTKENYDWAFSHGKIQTDDLSVIAFKLYADGALGSRGACLLKPYSDMAGHYGFLLKNESYYDSILHVIASHNWQACTHAIGDSGNRTILRKYEQVLTRQSDSRWRIEHAQVVNKNDFSLFAESRTVPSVQPTHATSDMYWAEKRLGKNRVESAYAYEQLLQQNGWLPLGTDFPVEDISPIKTFYAAVIRKDASGYPAEGFQISNALTREQALRGMTIWAARAAFEENKKGSLEKGKLADIIILDKDLMKVSEKEMLSTKTQMTIVSGKVVYKTNQHID